MKSFLPKRAKSWMCEHFFFFAEDSKLVQCLLCMDVVVYDTSTSKLQQHLQTKHRDVVDKHRSEVAKEHVEQKTLDVWFQANADSEFLTKLCEVGCRHLSAFQYLQKIPASDLQAIWTHLQEMMDQLPQLNKIMKVATWNLTILNYGGLLMSISFQSLPN